MRAVRWLAVGTLAAVGSLLVGVAAYVAYVARLWSLAMRDENPLA